MSTPHAHPRFAPVALALALATGFAARPTALPAQAITVYAEAYGQEWTGLGSSIPLYLFNHFQLPEAGQAEALDLIIDSLDLQYLQDYPEFRIAAEPTYYLRRAEYFQEALARNPDLDIVLVGSLYPPDLRHDTIINGREERRLDTRRDDIYGAVAEWYLEMMTYYAEAGVEVDILNLVNEPFQVPRRFGVSANPEPERFVGLLFDRAVDSLRAYVADPARNTSGVAMPLIMGPSDIGPSGSVRMIQYLQREVPEAYDNIDIVSFHQYTAGTSQVTISTLDRITGDKPLHQSEMHTNRGENIASINVLDKEDRGVLSLAAIFAAAVNGGANAWYYFLNVFPDDDSNPGLLQIQGGFERPRPFRQYYALKQLGATQPVGSRRVDRDVEGIGADGDVVAFRREGSDTVVVHYANYLPEPREVDLRILDDQGGQPLAIEYVVPRLSDTTVNDSALARIAVDDALAPVTLSAPAFSLNTYVVVLGEASGLSPKRAPAESISVTWEGEEVVVRAAAGIPLDEVRLVGMDGRVLARTDGASARFATGGLAAGVYVVTARTGAGVVSRRVVVW